MLKKLLLILCIGVQTVSFGQTKLASFFSDHMVLQQNENVSIWGTESPKEKITITTNWGATETTKSDKNGDWSLKLKTPIAGGPYSLKINGTETIEIKDIMIGEVWLCSGQSNMEMPVKGFLNQPVIGSQDAILNGSNKNLRVFTVERNQTLSPIENVNGNWKVASPSTVGNFSATAYFFGNKIQNTTKVPVGLIVTSWGGSRAEAWTDAATLKEFKSVKFPTEIPKKGIQQTPTLLYNAMLHPIIGYQIKGAIWYQGESNKNQASEYQKLITNMVTSWRKEWNQGDFPFYYVQIAPYNYGKKANSAFLREAQMHTMQSLENSGMAVTLDIGNKTYIHPAEKRKVGERLAYWALAKDYNVEGIEYSGPTFDAMKIDKEKVTVTFKNTPNGISSFGKEVTGFEIAGEDKIFHPAEASVIRKGYPHGAVLLHSKEVSKPVAVRYNFHNFVEASIFSTAGLPASSFRTDNWKE